MRPCRRPRAVFQHTMSPVREDLLRPSLSPSAMAARAPYSNQTAFVSAFIGGPFAAAAMFAINSWRIGRLARDAAWVVFALVAYLLWFVYIAPPGAALTFKALVTPWLGDSANRILLRLGALLICLAGMIRHRYEQRSTDLFGAKRPNGWAGGAGLIVAGWGANALLAIWLA